ncbi:cystathionine beta-lyase [Nonlabens sp. Hel1_33_55]|uniref:trans-sulfuration enzyme family protein n=1 Tax=Nonlabens sp. Hel1_33_55 TaxID=1336802 RepID=UPI000875B3E7|nr:PLP-dependent aspartate aminotransferase family protein [Nonlabens sp. Hel1_33_55]SCY17655.1 cystathionine beta-lyase [Nonlabens sp. Hel1_33_55]
MKNKRNVNYTCVHAGELKDTIYGGATAPIYTSTTYDYRGPGTNLYPRYFNTPNQVALAQKMSALEHTESSLIFGSGMAAISAVFMAFLKTGDHVVMQRAIYGGTSHFAAAEFDRVGITYTMLEHINEDTMKEAVQDNTQMLYIETPSNPLLEITDIEIVSAFAKANSITTVIDNTFASPINQNPADLGIDLIIHSATKYLGGHSDICAGTVSGTQKHMERLWKTAKNYGGSLSDVTVHLLERSIKTLALRVKQQSKTALKLAQFLEKHPDMQQVNYPGLKSHPNHQIAKKQMHAYGGMMSFELKNHIDHDDFLEELKVIKPALSLAGVESTILSPALTSHSLMTAEERKEQGITDRLLRFSVGIEEFNILVDDLEQALEKSRKR